MEAYKPLRPIFSLEASRERVKTFQQPESGLVSQAAEATSGLKCSDSLAKYDPDTCSWRTSQLSFQGELKQFSEDWLKSGMMRNGQLYRQRIAALPISANGSGYLPTPQASDGIFCGIERPVKLRGNAYRIESNQGIDGSAKLADIAWNVWGGLLNPTYVEAMMMLPIGWTVLKPLAMDSYQSWLRSF